MSSAVANANEFEEQRAQAERSLQDQRVQRDFLSIISHELRTPLSVVMGYSETLAKNVDQLNAEQVVSISARTRDASRRLARLIGDLVDLAQTDRGTLKLSIYPTSVERVLKQAAYEVSTPRHDLKVDCDENLPPVLADRDRLGQIVVNLINNARRYSPEGTTIRVEGRRLADGQVAISVADQGIGIRPELSEKIFERFFQVEDPARRTAAGMGIGLFLVKEICDRMNATITVDSEPGKGSRFTVTLPVADAVAS
jgi:two-component system phosphate regulon sensor histidine kinase PhoR